uniref:class I SAM-dependent methyltransferase n=1 Tax=Bradyrhizobium sp. (strain ORS 278) TaxID=114615 RepID=UPI0012FE9DFD|nr:class I SAM-dependent methyltransferase [Bradyrhizobium sp. ORS 278]
MRGPNDEMRRRPAIDFHDNIAANWETLHRSRTFRARTAAMFGLLEQQDLSGQRWLDAGCGTGTLSRLLAGRGCEVTGVDASAEMIRRARHLPTGSEQTGALRFDQIATIEALPFSDGAFDGVLCASVLEYVPDVPAALREIHRVLRVDGLVLLSIPNRASLLRQAFKLAFAVSSRAWTRPMFRYLSVSKFDASATTATHLMQDIGFSVLALNFSGTPLPAFLDHTPRFGTLMNILARRMA